MIVTIEAEIEVNDLAPNDPKIHDIKGILEKYAKELDRDAEVKKIKIIQKISM